MGQSLPADRPPKLVIQLVLGGMPPSALVRAWNNFEPRGIPLLRAQGVECIAASYGHLLGNTPSGLATIASGTTPDTHGVSASKWYDHITNEPQSLIADKVCGAVGDSYNDYNVSPQKLLVATLAQAWRAVFPQSHIYSMSLSPLPAILLAGRAANAALWMNEKTGHFVSSTYYCDTLPQFVTQFNRNGVAAMYLKQPWQPAKRSHAYASLLMRNSPLQDASQFDDPKFSIPATTISIGPQYAKLASMPRGNTLLRDLLVAAIEGDRLGRNAEPDLLSVYFSPFENIATLYGPESMQYEDALFRFDAELAQLLDYLNATVGKKQYLLVLTSAYAASPSVEYLQAWRIPSGQFNPDRALFLLNSYLRARYGVADLVRGHAGQQFYLNRPLIEKHSLSLSSLGEQAAQFLQDMAGVSAAYPANILQWGGGARSRAQRAASNFHPKRSGDVVVDLLPGWSVVSERFPTAKNGESSYDMHVPLFFFGWKLGPRRVVHSVAPCDIAPTICHLMQIAPPNAATGQPIEGVADWDK